MSGLGVAGRLVSYLFLLAVLWLFERRRPSRPDVAAPAPRWKANLSLGATNVILLWIAFGGWAAQVVFQSQHRRFGLLARLGWPCLLSWIAGVAVLDFGLYVWHVANHRYRLLWRFHRVHHSDPDLDVTTASRFHAGELLLGRALETGFAILLGMPLGAVILFDALVVAVSQFHHSRVRVPRGLQRVFNWISVPPRMHHVHHSRWLSQTNSNYGTIFSFWDRIFGTFRPNPAPEAIVIGLETVDMDTATSFARLLALPGRPMR